MAKKPTSPKTTDASVLSVPPVKTTVKKPAGKKAATPKAESKPAKTAPARTTVKAKIVTKSGTAAASITPADIALRAYFIAEKRQKLGLPGDSTSDWVEAERQLKAEASAKTEK